MGLTKKDGDRLPVYEEEIAVVLYHASELEY